MTGLADPHAEALVLCGLMREPGLVFADVLRAGLTWGDFTRPTHRVAFAGLCELVGEGDGGTGPYSLWRWLAAGGLDCRAGELSAKWVGEVYLADPTGMGSCWAIRRVRELADLRERVRKATTTERSCRAN